jgi:hypothetical protein
MVRSMCPGLIDRGIRFRRNTVGAREAYCSGSIVVEGVYTPGMKMIAMKTYPSCGSSGDKQGKGEQ